jgi:Permuted papain-like amidase enzyme, YaeF/YiiX, C92 family
MSQRKGPYRLLLDRMVAVLVKEHRGYTRRFPNDLDKLRATLRPGDVVLVEGSQRVSEVIKYLTQSCWSHAALYVGDALLKRSGAESKHYREKFGSDAAALLVESTLEEGVTASSLSKYVNHNIRICRPINLRPGDLATVLDSVISQLGQPYGVDHIIDLLRYFFPVRFIPRRFRYTALRHGGRVSKEVVCSSQIAMAFQRVRYPIQAVISEETLGNGRPRRLPEWLVASLRRTGRSVFETSVFTPCDPLFVTPRDFDLSPYFEVVKFSRRDFDYKKIKWAPAAVAERQPAVEPQPIATPAPLAASKAVG